MLVEFSVGNFWSFKDIQTLQLQAAKIVSRFPEVDKENIIVVNPQLSLLKTKAVFGANASGKTNLVRGMVAMLQIIKECLKDTEVLEKSIIPFQLDEASMGAPCFFQLIFILDNTLYRYGFEATRKEVASEWLFGKDLTAEEQVRERYYFTRDGMKVTVNESVFKEGKQFASLKKGALPLYRENSLFLSVAAAWNGPLAKKITEKLQQQVRIISERTLERTLNIALNAMSDPDFQQKATMLLKSVDPTISKIERIETGPAPIYSNHSSNSIVEEPMISLAKKADIAVVRKLKDKEVPFMMSYQEAEGTKKLFSLSPLIFDALKLGSILVIDEFDARMHPKLTRKIVELFHSANTNPNNAQLIFTTHDTNLLDAKLLRRDQVSFVKKSKDGASELYSLVEFKGVRNDASFEKDYLLGKYDAVPTNLNGLDELFQE